MLPLPAGREASAGVCVRVYLRHRQERTLLYQLVETYCPVLLSRIAMSGRSGGEGRQSRRRHQRRLVHRQGRAGSGDDRAGCIAPGYSLAGHKGGYPSPAHLAALKRLGVTPTHRRSLAPVRRRLASD